MERLVPRFRLHIPDIKDEVHKPFDLSNLRFFILKSGPRWLFKKARKKTIGILQRAYVEAWLFPLPCCGVPDTKALVMHMTVRRVLRCCHHVRCHHLLSGPLDAPTHVFLDRKSIHLLCYRLWSRVHANMDISTGAELRTRDGRINDVPGFPKCVIGRSSTVILI